MSKIKLTSMLEFGGANARIEEYDGDGQKYETIQQALSAATLIAVRADNHGKMNLLVCVTSVGSGTIMGYVSTDIDSESYFDPDARKEYLNV